ncbi:DUF1127 domain-containing protein [Tropicimonas isoalkanivorans]|uniref:YjiS-like domain-containing protein n=1 Tax=Tropicimonas isoalkanivorans TaxID=441112 RepID=A0A1I1IR75_9RHOB|nr:DUF1127 domain-containing protein [Tropicimonas isoalkanivorans]SFC38734.1 protein of unknown function [Tropicimonas isoalkanivorans]
MAQFSPPSDPRLESLSARPSLPLLADLALWVATAVVKWDCRQRSRRALARLSPEHLKDIGITPDMADHEVRKPFWIP